MTPQALELSLAVQDEIGAQLEESDRLRQQQVQRTEYEAELARTSGITQNRPVEIT